MDRKTKLLAAIAASILAVGIGLSVVSCVARDNALHVEEPSQTQEEEAASEKGLSGFERACVIAWTADNGAQLQLSKGMILEKGTDGALHILTVSSESETSAGKQTLISVEGIDEDSKEKAAWTLILDEASGIATLSSDNFKLAKSYVQKLDINSVAVTGVDESFLALVGGDITPLEESLKSFMAKELPQAVTASFDGEAFIDFKTKTVSATFHTDDAAKTVLTVSYSGGKFAVSK